MNTFRNKIGKLKVTPEEVKPIPYRTKWSEERKVALWEAMMKYWKTRKTLRKIETTCISFSDFGDIP